MRTSNGEIETGGKKSKDYCFLRKLARNLLHITDLFFFLVALISFLAVTKMTIAQPVTMGSISEDAFRAHYEKALRRMEDFFSEIDASGSLQVKEPARGVTTKSKWRFQKTDGASKHSVQQISPPVSEKTSVAETIWCRNPKRYVFELVKPLNGSEYLVRKKLPKDTNPGQGTDIFANRFVKASFSVCGIHFAQIMADPSFSIKSISKEQGDSKTVVLTYDFIPKSDATESSIGKDTFMPPQVSLLP